MLSSCKFGIYAFFLIFLSENSFAQERIDALIFKDISVFDHNVQFLGETIEELSGIEYTGNGNYYYVIPQSREKAHIFLVKIEVADTGMAVKFDSVIYLSHGPLEAESVRISPKDNQLYIAEEGDGTSYVYKLNDENKLDVVYTSTTEQRHNRGYEGLCFSPDGETVYMGLERPKSGDITNIIAYNLADQTEKVYNYNLDILPDDKRTDNGITELLTLNDSTLLVVERAYLGPKGNSIRIYKAIIPSEGNEIIKDKLLTDFSASPEIDNIEGVSFSASGNELIFMSDNNGNPYQKTLFIRMRIE